MISNSRLALLGWLVMLLAVLSGCTATAATKIQCESNLRPINPANLEHPQP